MNELREALKQEKTCAVFVLPEHKGNHTAGSSKPHPFRNEATLKLGSKLASCLSSAGYNVTPARPGKSSEAFFQVVQPRWKVNVLLQSEAAHDGTLYRLVLWPRVPILNRLRGTIDLSGIRGCLADVLSRSTGYVRATLEPLAVSSMSRDEMERSTIAVS